MMVELAIVTGIPVSAWAAEPPRVIATAARVLEAQARARRGP